MKVAVLILLALGFLAGAVRYMVEPYLDKPEMGHGRPPVSKLWAALIFVSLGLLMLMPWIL